MTDLVDYLREKLLECSCERYTVGRPEVGFYQFWNWNESCPRHSHPDTWRESNAEVSRVLDAANARDWERQKERARAIERTGFIDKLFKKKA